VLRIAQRINACFPDPGMVSRVAGDEFAACCLVGDPGHVRSVAERLMQEFAAPFEVAGREHHLTLSVGVSVFPVDGSEIAAGIGKAESAMLLARERGGNCIKFYAQRTRDASREALLLEAALPKAIRTGEFFLEYQPSIDFVSRSIRGVEALLRWRHPRFGVVPPDRFIPLADETGLIIELGYWVLREACAQARVWHDLGFQDLSVAVNVSAVQFGHPGLVDRVRGTLAETGLVPTALELELTESVSLQDVETTTGTLHALKDMGVRIALDDFGTGYSSLRYLKQFPLDTIKIDKTFVNDVTTDPVDAALVRSIISLGQIVGLTTVAEGVETQQQFDFLRIENCDRMQGYFFSRPISADAVLALRRQQLQPAIHTIGNVARP
jgi:EAL domain-containing protein (putative c-di-GMP-specific phosphodiesterase class I)